MANKNPDEEQPKLRVATYCRISTDSDEQATSYEAQIEHYTSYIKSNLSWELAGIFADDGISRTLTPSTARNSIARSKNAWPALMTWSLQNRSADLPGIRWIA